MISYFVVIFLALKPSRKDLFHCMRWRWQTPRCQAFCYWLASSTIRPDDKFPILWIPFHFSLRLVRTLPITGKGRAGFTYWEENIIGCCHSACNIKYLSKQLTLRLGGKKQNQRELIISCLSSEIHTHYPLLPNSLHGCHRGTHADSGSMFQYCTEEMVSSEFYNFYIYLCINFMYKFSFNWCIWQVRRMISSQHVNFRNTKSTKE